MTQPSLQDDLTYLRDLAEGGQNAPLLGGRFYAWWGGLASLAYLGHFAIAERLVAGFGPQHLNWMWGGFMMVGLAGFALLVLTFPKSKPGQSSAGNRVSQTLWMAGGLAMFAFFIGVATRSYLDGESSIGFVWSVPLVLTVYGIGQITTGHMAKSGPLEFAGWAALVAVGFAAVFSASNAIWLVGAAAAFFAVFVPGILLMLREPRDLV